MLFPRAHLSTFELSSALNQFPERNPSCLTPFTRLIPAANSGLSESRISCGDQPSERSQAAWVSLRELVERGGEFESTQVCSWKQHASEARLRDAGLAVWLRFSQIGTCGPGVG